MGNRTTQPVLGRVRQIPSEIDMTQGSQTQNMEAAESIAHAQYYYQIWDVKHQDHVRSWESSESCERNYQI